MSTTVSLNHSLTLPIFRLKNSRTFPKLNSGIPLRTIKRGRHTRILLTTGFTRIQTSQLVRQIQMTSLMKLLLLSKREMIDGTTSKQATRREPWSYGNTFMISLNTWLKHLTRRRRKMRRSQLRKSNNLKKKSSSMILITQDLKYMKATTLREKLLKVLRVYTALSHQGILLACKTWKHHHYLNGTIILELLDKSFKLHLWHLIDRLNIPYLEQTQRRLLSATSSSRELWNL